jgi:mitochondrial fission protein ELM1
MGLLHMQKVIMTLSRRAERHLRKTIKAMTSSTAILMDLLLMTKSPSQNSLDRIVHRMEHPVFPV